MSAEMKSTAPSKHCTAENGDASDFHAVEAGSIFLALKLCPIHVEFAGDVCRDEVHRPFEHYTAEDGQASDFHAVEVGVCLKRAVLE